MPRVPRVDGPTVAQQPLNGGMLRTVEPVVNRQAGEFARALEVTGAEIQERADADELMRAEAEIKSRYLQWEGEAKQRRGQQAWGVAKEAGEWWDKQGEEVGQTITSQRARAQFQREVLKNRGMAAGAFAGYEAGQRRESLDQSAQASIVGSINLAAANPQNLELLNATKADIVKRNQMRAKLNGWAPEVATVKEQEYLTSLHKQVLQGLVDRDPTAAEAYFAANKAEIAGADHAEVEKILKVGMSTRRAQTFADEVMAAGMSEADALAKARSQFDGDDEKNAVAEVKTRFAENTMARERAQKDAADEAFGIYARAGRLSAVPASVLARMDGKTILTLRQTAQADADRLAGREVKLPPTDWGRYYELRREALENPEAFKRRDLRAEFGHLGKAEREGLIDLQAKKPEELKDVATFDQQLSNMHDVLKLGGAANQEKRGRFDQVATSVIQAEERRTGKKLSFDERQKHLDRLAIQGEGGWFTSGKRLFEVAGTAEEGKFVPKITADTRKLIVQALNAEGIRQPTEEQIVARFRLKFGIR